MKPLKCLLSFSLLFLCSCSIFTKSKQESTVIREVSEDQTQNSADNNKDNFHKKGFKPAKGALSSFELGRYQYCGDDRDCIVASNGCCDCANGSSDVSINKTRLEAFKTRFNCTDVYCGMKAQDPACGSGVVSCVNHKCKYFGPGEDLKKH